MSKKIAQIMITSSIFVRGVMCSKDKVLKVVDNPNIKNDEINLREAQELISRGKATEDVEIDLNIESDEDTTKPLEEMKKDELIAYANEIGIDIPAGATKAEIIDLINADDEE